MVRSTSSSSRLSLAIVVFLCSLLDLEVGGEVVLLSCGCGIK